MQQFSLLHRSHQTVYMKRLLLLLLLMNLLDLCLGSFRTRLPVLWIQLHSTQVMHSDRSEPSQRRTLTRCWELPVLLTRDCQPASNCVFALLLTCHSAAMLVCTCLQANRFRCRLVDADLCLKNLECGHLPLCMLHVSFEPLRLIAAGASTLALPCDIRQSIDAVTTKQKAAKVPWHGFQLDSAVVVHSHLVFQDHVATSGISCDASAETSR